MLQYLNVLTEVSYDVFVVYHISYVVFVVYHMLLCCHCYVSHVVMWPLLCITSLAIVYGKSAQCIRWPQF